MAPFPIFNVGRKVTILFGAKSNIAKGGGGGGEGGYLKIDATFSTLLSRIVVLRKLGLLFVPIYGKNRTANAIS